MSRRIVIVSAALGVAVVLGVGAFLAVRDDARLDTDELSGRTELITPNAVLKADVVSQPGTRTAMLKPEGVGGNVVGMAAVAPDGNGALYEIRLPQARAGEIVWAWLVANEHTVPIGAVADTTTENVLFKVTGETTAVDGVVLTVETSLVQPDTPGPVVARATF